MNVQIVTFPETRVAFVSHKGSPAQEYDTLRKLIAWKIEHKLFDQSRYRMVGLHYADPGTVAPQDYRVDFCLSFEGPVVPNDFGVGTMVIASMKCALARDVGSRKNNQAVRYLYEEWLPRSGETMASRPILFHYVNVGPGVREQEAITDVYLPLL